MSLIDYVPDYYHYFFVELDFLSAHHLKFLLFNIVGLSLIVASLIARLPQIIKIWKYQSAQTINIFTVLANLNSITIKACYCYAKAFPFSAYGELLASGIQTFIIAILVLHFNAPSSTTSIFVVIYATFCYILGGLTPLNVLWMLQGLSVPITFIGKILQICTIYKEKDPGRISLTTCCLQLYIVVMRVITSFLETNDLMLVVSYSSSSFTLAIITAMVLYYGRYKRETCSSEKSIKK